MVTAYTIYHHYRALFCLVTVHITGLEGLRKAMGTVNAAETDLN